MVTSAQHQAALDRQAQDKADNAAQKAAFWLLRNGGKEEAAAQMASPISTQTYNIRGEKIVVLGRGIKSAGRIAAEKETERIQAEMQALQARNEQMISTYSNSTNLPSFDAQSEQFNKNNNVNPSALYTSQPVTVTGQGQNSTVSGGINTDANYNYATALNNYQTANPYSQINLGKETQTNYTAGLSSVPYDNEVKTSDLGGDIQHQETDVNTNLEYVHETTTNVNWAQSTMPSFGITALVLGGIALLGLRK
tara:strand:- start:3608 stop:4363 length:756 start_codon:yes stop_codon:yes gene_type:complete